MVGIALRTAMLPLSVLTLAVAAFAQPASEGTAAREQQILQSIERERAQNGPYSEGLIGPLSALALLYRENGNDELAFAATKQVLEAVRATDGVHSLDQIPLIQQLIAIEESHGNAAAAWDFEQRLLTLARRHPDDLRTIPVLRKAAEKRTELLARFRAGETRPEIELGCYAGWPQSGEHGGLQGGCDAGTRSEIVRALVSDAQRNYAEAIAVVLRNRQYGSAELRELEMGLLGSIEVTRTENPSGLDGVLTETEPWRSWAHALGVLANVRVPNPTGLQLVPGNPPAPPHGRFDYRLGRESLVRLFAYELATPSALPVQIDAFLRIADWDLLDSHNALALGEYEQVYRLLAERGERASIDELLSPELPVVLPAHVARPLATTATDSYIDVAFEVTQLGEGRKIEIAGTTAGVTSEDKNALVALIRGSRFRPRSQGGEPARASPIVLRYYLDP